MPLPSGPSPTRDQLLTLLRALLLQILPNGVEVIVGQGNRTPEPTSEDYVIMTPTGVRRLATTVDTWSSSTSPYPTTLEHEQDVAVKVQLDVHGEGSTDNTNVITTLLRSSFAVDFFTGTGMVPLTCDDGNQLPFPSGEHQYEDRWVVETQFQMSVAMATQQQFADTWTITVKAPADAMTV
jgi:hypothetical protein